MLQLTPQSRIWLALAPVDFRKGIDGLAAVCRRSFVRNPLDGAIYVFRNRAGTPYKCRFFHVSFSSTGSDKMSGDMGRAGQGSGQPWPIGNG